MLICVSVQFISGGIKMAIADPIDEATAFQNETRKNKAIYTAVSGKQPTFDNLIKSIRMENIKGLHDSEIAQALDLLIMGKGKDQTLVPDILECYNRNSSWLVRVLCVEMLLNIDEDKGVELAKKIINDPKIELRAKLSMSRKLVAKGKLFAYPILREGLTTTSNYQKRIALELLEQYRSYDGKVWDEKSGEKINVDQLLKDTKGIATTNKTDGHANIIWDVSQPTTNQAAVGVQQIPGTGKTNDLGKGVKRDRKG